MPGGQERRMRFPILSDQHVCFLQTFFQPVQLGSTLRRFSSNSLVKSGFVKRKSLRPRYTAQPFGSPAPRARARRASRRSLRKVSQVNCTGRNSWVYATVRYRFMCSVALFACFCKGFGQEPEATHRLVGRTPWPLDLIGVCRLSVAGALQKAVARFSFSLL